MTFQSEALMEPTQRLQLLIGILGQSNICACLSWLALDIQPGTTTERHVLRDRPLGLQLQVVLL